MSANTGAFISGPGGGEVGGGGTIYLGTCTCLYVP